MHALQKTWLGLGPVLLVAASALSVPARADDQVGRYQMVTLPQLPGSFESRVMILDTRDGHLWQWWQLPAVGGSQPSSGISYLGKVTPGAGGEGLPANRAGTPDIAAPARNRH
jgi:hypothetical protein